MSKISLILAAAALLLSAGCAKVSPQWNDIEEKSPDTVYTDVHFFPQEKYQCGPAVLAMLINNAGGDVTPDELVPSVYTPSKKGSIQSAMVASTRRHGKVPYVFRNPEMLVDGLQKGRPAGVLMNLGLSFAESAERWHYAVVNGVDFKNDEIIMHSGLDEDYRMKLATFDHTWRRGSYWALYVLRPGDIPDGAEPLKYVQSVSAFENMGELDIAETSYRAALEKWNDNLFVLLGLANVMYAKGDLEAAESALAKAVKKSPGSAEANNNYAYVLYKLGKVSMAKEHAERAVEIGGVHKSAYEDTLAEILNSQEP